MQTGQPGQNRAAFVIVTNRPTIVRTKTDASNSTPLRAKEVWIEYLISLIILLFQIEWIAKKQNGGKSKPLQSIPEMRTFRQLNNRLVGYGRCGVFRLSIRLNKNIENGIRHLPGHFLQVEIVPNLEPGPVHRQRIRDPAEGWFALPKPNLPRNRDST